MTDVMEREVTDYAFTSPYLEPLDWSWVRCLIDHADESSPVTLERTDEQGVAKVVEELSPGDLAGLADFLEVNKGVISVRLSENVLPGDKTPIIEVGRADRFIHAAVSWFRTHAEANQAVDVVELPLATIRNGVTLSSQE